MLPTNEPNSLIDDTPIPGQETVKRHEISKKKLAYLIVGVVFVLLLAIFGLVGGYISTGSSKEQTVATSFDLAPPNANPKHIDSRNKYDLGYSLSPNATGPDAPRPAGRREFAEADRTRPRPKNDQQRAVE